jgi:hypothetical protein
MREALVIQFYSDGTLSDWRGSGVEPGRVEQAELSQLHEDEVLRPPRYQPDDLRCGSQLLQLPVSSNTM